MATTPRRARRAQARGFATRTAERRNRMRQRFTSATTAEAQASAAWDWWRSSVQHADEVTRAGRLRDMAQRLAADAQAIESSDSQ